MRALKMLKWKGLKAQENHLSSNDKVSDWENEEAMRVDGDDAIGPTCYAESVTFLMKQAKRSLKRLSLFKTIRVECSLIHDDCLKALDTQKLSAKQRKKLENDMHEAASYQGFVEEWIKNETVWFKYLDDYLEDVFERFTALFTRTDPSDADLDLGDEIDPSEYVPKPISLTRH